MNDHCHTSWVLINDGIASDESITAFDQVKK